MSSSSTARVSKSLTAFARMNRNAEGSFISDEVLPVIPVAANKGHFFSLSGGRSYSPGTTQDLRRAYATEFGTIHTSVSKTDMYDLFSMGLQIGIDDDEREDYAEEGLNLERGKLLRLQEELLIARENANFTNLLFNASVITQTAALASGSRWDDDGADPRDNADAAAAVIEKATSKPQEMLSLVVNPEGFRALRKNAALMQFFRSANPGQTHMTAEQIAMALGIKDVKVARGVRNTAVQGAAESISYIAGKSGLFCYIDPNPSQFDSRGLGYTFQKRGVGQGIVETYRNEAITSDMLRIKYKEDPVIANATAGYLFTTVVS